MTPPPCADADALPKSSASTGSVHEIPRTIRASHDAHARLCP
ncbi:MAG: hypothetical protein ACK6CU_24890 [Deltaproteobacteria bacterium]